MSSDAVAVRSDAAAARAGVTAVRSDAAAVRSGVSQAGSASFADRQVVEQRGDVVTITVNHRNTQRSTVYLGSKDVGFFVEVHLRGSNRVKLHLNTYRTDGSPGEFLRAEGGSIVNATMHTDRLSHPIYTGVYLVNVSVGGVEQDLGEFVLQDRSMAASSYVAPSAVDVADEEVATVLKRATERERVARGDWAVVRFDASGLEGAFDPDHLHGGASAEGIAVEFVKQETNANQAAESFYASESSDVVVKPSLDDDQVVVAWDTDDVDLDGRRDEYEVTLRLDREYNALLDADDDEDESVSTRVVVAADRVTLNNGHDIDIPPWESQFTVTGSTNLAPGTSLSVRARSTSPAFLKQQSATVGTDGTFEATLDVSDVERGVSFSVFALHHEADDVEATLEASSAALVFDNQTTDGTTLLVDSVSLSHGGHVVVRTSDGTVLGTSGYLDAGDHDDVPVALASALSANATLTATAHFDTDGDGTYDAKGADEAYRENGSAVADTANVTLQRTTTTATTTTNTTTATTATTTVTGSGGATTTPAANASTTQSTVRTTLPPGVEPLPQPGFGPGMALVAVLAAAALAARR
ncbi:BGTF surface domain-containing protein [Halobacteriaceae archaeon GCM10025711]